MTYREPAAQNDAHAFERQQRFDEIPPPTQRRGRYAAYAFVSLIGASGVACGLQIPMFGTFVVQGVVVLTVLALLLVAVVGRPEESSKRVARTLLIDGQGLSFVSGPKIRNAVWANVVDARIDVSPELEHFALVRTTQPGMDADETLGPLHREDAKALCAAVNQGVYEHNVVRRASRLLEGEALVLGDGIATKDELQLGPHRWPWSSIAHVRASPWELTFALKDDAAEPLTVFGVEHAERCALVLREALGIVVENRPTTEPARPAEATFLRVDASNESSNESSNDACSAPDVHHTDRDARPDRSRQ